MENSIYNVGLVIIAYKPIVGRINEKLDKKIIKFANELGLIEVGSGYNLKNNIRDLSFEHIYENK